MKIQELSHGNWVFIDGEPAKVKSISYLVIGDNPISLIVEYRNGRNDMPSEMTNKIEPIPLTPEILEKNGFVACQYWHELKFNDAVIQIALPDFRMKNGEIEFTANNLQYVHQLQNFLTLCGVELEIKL